MAARKGLQLRTLFQTGGTFVALFVLVILGLFLVTLPPWLLDLLLVTNLFLAITLLLRSVFSERSSPLYSFPTVLVLATLFRLALNVSSTKLILLQGDEGLDAAGRVIQAFGTFVVQGDFVVGFILFAIIAIVNFVVIAKGAARVAEVAARFSLDALPGRQLSIDSDLRSENVTSDQARVLRQELDSQSQFFGSMDGAMKWVQGDAIAGFVITCINLVGGVSVGLLRVMPFADAVSTFGILTIGDGLLSILPSLLISVAAGIVVTNTTDVRGDDSANQVISQLVSDPRAPLLAAGSLVLVGALGLLGIADFPALPFFILGFCTFAFFHYAELRKDRVSGANAPQLLAWPLSSAIEHQRTPAQVVPLRIELDQQGLGALLTAEDSKWSDEFWRFAEEHAQEFLLRHGVALPRPVLTASPRLAEGEYRVYVRDRLVCSGTLQAGVVLADTHEAIAKLYGASIQSTRQHPILQRNCSWIKATPAVEQALRRLKISLYSPIQFLWLDAVGAVLESVDDIIGIAEVRQLVDAAEPSVRELLAELIAADRITLPELAELFRRLVRERVSVRDVKRLVEGVAEFAVLTPREQNRRQEWLLELHEFLRTLMVRGIMQSCVGPSGVVRTFLLSKEVEEEFFSAVSLWDRMRTPPPLDPTVAQQLRESSYRLFTPVIDRGALPVVVVCAGEIRIAAQEFFARLYPSSDWFRTVSYEELASAEHVELVSVLHASV